MLVVQMRGKRVRATGTYNCVSDNGVLDAGRDGDLVLSDPKMAWVNSQYDVVDKWLTEAVEAAKVIA